MCPVDADEQPGPEPKSSHGSGGAAAEQFQHAALEAVRAARLMLDAAERVIRDPSSLEPMIRGAAGVARTATETVAGFAAAAGTPQAQRTRTRADEGSDDPDDPDEGYEPISVS